MATLTRAHRRSTASANGTAVRRRYLNKVSGTSAAKDHATDSTVMLPSEYGEWNLAGIAVLADIVGHPMLLPIVDDDCSPPSSFGIIVLHNILIFPVG